MGLYQHVNVVISILVGFSLTRLLNAAPQLAQHERKRVYWVHLVWVLFMFIYVIGFWWWEFQLSTIRQWTFPLYVFVIVYGVLVYFLCALLSPENLTHFPGFKEYFFSRRKWFFGAMALMSIADVYDTYMKGPKHFHALGNAYKLQMSLYLVCSLIAMKVKSERFHAAFAVLALLSEIFFELGEFFTFG